VQEAEGDPARRAFTLDELQALFDYADVQVARVWAAGRKGWLSLFRDATLLKTAYGYGLRRTETAMLDVVDFGANAHAGEFGDFGLCRVRFGKAKKGSPPKPRTVLTVWPWTVEILQQWTQEIRPLMAEADSPALWPSERGERLTVSAINRRLTEYRRALGLGPGLDFHSLRRSYVTHLTEDGWDPLFVQVLLSPLEGVHDVQHRPELLQRTGVGPDSAATLLVTIGDNPDRMASEASFAALCGASPIEASSGKTQRRRLNRGGDRQAKAALYRIVLNRLRWDPHTRVYLDRRISEGRTRREAIRCLKRYVARELYPLLTAAGRSTTPAASTA
jgi:hypothetical protein